MPSTFNLFKDLHAFTVLILLITGCDIYKAPDECSEVFKDRSDLLSNFSIAAPGLVTIDDSSILWSRCPAGMQFKEPQSCIGEQLLLNFDQAQIYAMETAEKSGQNIRLPTTDEMDSISESKCINPALNLNIFPSSISDNHWTSNENISRRNVACVFYTFQGRKSCLEPKEMQHPFMLVIESDPF